MLETGLTVGAWIAQGMEIHIHTDARPIARIGKSNQKCSAFWRAGTKRDLIRMMSSAFLHETFKT